MFRISIITSIVACMIGSIHVDSIAYTRPFVHNATDNIIDSTQLHGYLRNRAQEYCNAIQKKRVNTIDDQASYEVATEVKSVENTVRGGENAYVSYSLDLIEQHIQRVLLEYIIKSAYAQTKNREGGSEKVAARFAQSTRDNVIAGNHTHVNKIHEYIGSRLLTKVVKNLKAQQANVQEQEDIQPGAPVHNNNNAFANFLQGILDMLR